jgi:hypothetical protein
VPLKLIELRLEQSAAKQEKKWARVLLPKGSKLCKGVTNCKPIMIDNKWIYKKTGIRGLVRLCPKTHVAKKKKTMINASLSGFD